MSGLARWYAANGYTVSGCDTSETSKTLTLLKDSGIDVLHGHSPKHLAGVDILISSMAVSDDDAELVAAQQGKLKTLKRIALLGELFEMHDAIGVTGTHGKSTTTGMIAALFLAAGADPSIQIGADLPEIKGNYHHGKGKHLIAEVDESDPGFANLKCHTAIVTNLEDDHIAGEFEERRNYHASLADLEKAVTHYASSAKQFLYCADWDSLTTLFHDAKHGKSYGQHDKADYKIVTSTHKVDGSEFDFRLPNGETYSVELSIPGVHNIQNAAAALACAHLNGLDMTTAINALRKYQGVGRRWQMLGKVKGAVIIDDYAVHPTEVAVVLKVAKDTGRRVRAVLQPHRWVRTARLWQDLADAAGLADEVLVLDIYGAGETAIPGISSELIVERLLEEGKRASHHTHDSAKTYLIDTLLENDLVITLGAGDVWQVGAAIAHQDKPLFEVS